MIAILVITITVIAVFKPQAYALSNVTIFAGTGTQGWTGDNGPATSANINFVAGCLVDSNSDTFLVDYSAHVVRKVNTAGIITTIGGTGSYGLANTGGAFTSVKLYNPWGVHGDSNFLYISDFYHIWKYNRATGIVAIMAGTGTQGIAGDGGPATSAQIYKACGLWLTTDGILYLTEYGNNVVRKITTANIISTVVGGGGLGYAGDGGPAASTNVKLYYPQGVYVDTNGVFFADRNNGRIGYVVNGIVDTYVGGGPSGNTADGFVGTNAWFSTPFDVKADTIGNIFVLEGTNKLKVVDYSTKVVTTYVNSGLNAPRGMWLGYGTTNKICLGMIAYAKTVPLYVNSASAVPTASPVLNPTANPTVNVSTIPAFTPTVTPTETPTLVLTTTIPSETPTYTPTFFASSIPTGFPSALPTIVPSDTPSTVPTTFPTLRPSVTPSLAPYTLPTDAPTTAPTIIPSSALTETPTKAPSKIPTVSPTATPTTVPITAPTIHPSFNPSLAPSLVPTQTQSPSRAPSISPSSILTASPSNAPSKIPTRVPTLIPTINPSVVHTTAPTSSQTKTPSFPPSAVPSTVRTTFPTFLSTMESTFLPTTLPTVIPSGFPSSFPSTFPSSVPSSAPTRIPTAPSCLPTAAPSSSPTAVNPDEVKVDATTRVKFVHGTILNDVSLATLITAFQNISDNPQSTTIVSATLISQSSSSIKNTNVKARSLRVIQGAYTHDVSFRNTYVMALHPGYNSSQLASLKVAKIQQQIELGSFETILRNLAVMNNATQLLNSTCNEVTEMGAVVISPSSAGSSSSSDGYSTGVVVGIVLGVVFGLLVLSIVLYLRLKKWRQDISNIPLPVNPGTAVDTRYY